MTTDRKTDADWHAENSRQRFAIDHNGAAKMMAFAVADGIITDDQRLAILTGWPVWWTRTYTEACYQSGDDAERIREQHYQHESTTAGDSP